MDKPISDIMQKQVITVDIDDTIEDVEETLQRYKLSHVPVVDADGHCFGVISSVDLVHFHAIRKNPKAQHAWEVCTHKVIEVGMDVSVKEVAALMLKHKIHHVVVTEGRAITGIASSLDLIESYC